MSFNSPIGYSKNPIVDQALTKDIDPYNDKKKSLETIPTESVKKNGNEKLSQGNNREYSGNPLNSKGLQYLPYEILELILLELSQFDLLNLLKTNHRMYDIVHPKLFENVIIDGNFSAFNKEFPRFHIQSINNSTKKLNAIYINSNYNFKKFLVNYHEARRPIFRFQCVCLPDSVTIIDQHLESLLIKLFSQLDQLQEFIWVPRNFDCRYLSYLPKDLLSLKINLNKETGFENLFKFNQLEMLHINSYKTIQNLTKLVQVFERTHDSLVSLKIGKKEVKYSEIPNPPSSQLMSLEGVANDLKRICTYGYPHVTKLSLTGLMVQEDDFAHLNDSINLGNLVDLELGQLIESKTLETSSFLEKLGPKLTNIKYLSLDYRESHKDNVPKFLKTINKLTKLNLIARINDTKPFKDYLYAEALQYHKPSLTHLAINFKLETGINFIDLPINLSLIDLSELKQLKSLKFNSNNEANNVCVIQNLPNLKYLQLFGLKAGGAPNLGLGMIHPNIFDEWFKVQHVALIYYDNNQNLDYIKINNCLFECKDKVIPRDGIDNWFSDIIE